MGFLYDCNIINSFWVSFNLKFLLDCRRRDNVIRFYFWEIMSIGWVLGCSYIVIIFDSIWIFVSNHFRCNRFDIIFFDEGWKINNSNITKFISQYKFTWSWFLLSFFWVEWINEGNLWWFLDAIHIFPLREKFVGIFVVVFGCEKVDSAFGIDNNKEGKRIDEKNIGYLVRNNDLSLQESFFEVPHLAGITFTKSCNH